jgi:hypothetical protein
MTAAKQFADPIVQNAKATNNNFCIYLPTYKRKLLESGRSGLSNEQDAGCRKERMVKSKKSQNAKSCQ